MFFKVSSRFSRLNCSHMSRVSWRQQRQVLGIYSPCQFRVPADPSITVWPDLTGTRRVAQLTLMTGNACAWLNAAQKFSL